MVLLLTVGFFVDTLDLVRIKKGVCVRRGKGDTTDDFKFGSEFEPGQYIVAQLWRRDGRRMGSIRIVKKVRVKPGKKFPFFWRGQPYLAFYIYDHVSPVSEADAALGDVINLDPILSFKDALNVAKQREDEMLKTGKWMHARNAKGGIFSQR